MSKKRVNGKRWLQVGVLALSLSVALGCGDDEEDAEKVEAKAGILEMETFLTNINHPSGDRYAKLKLKLAVAPDTRAAEIQEDAVVMARLRDQVLTLLSSKTPKDLGDAEAKAGFRNEIREKLAPLIEDAELREVLFSEFVVQ